jgi:ABC-type uncharacterized transport system ATPase subunit
VTSGFPATADAARAPVPKLEMRGITKRYPGVTANDHIDLDLQPGEIHALLGENGAGKTTLMNILYGLAVPDEGQILIDGTPVRIAGPSDAIARGIEMVHQHFMLIPVLSVAENVVLGAETMANPIFLDLREASRRIREAYPKVAVLLLSTYDREEFAPRIAESGAVAFISKATFGPDGLMEMWTRAAVVN